MTAFDVATGVRARPDGATFDVLLDESWTIGPGRPNGGYLLATLGRAAVTRLAAEPGAQAFIVAANAQYLTSPVTGPAIVETEILRRGRTASQVRARLVQGDVVGVEALFTLGNLRDGSSSWWGGVAPVDLPAEEDCVRLPRLQPGPPRPSVHDSINIRFDPACVGFLDGSPSGHGELRAWFRFSSDHPVDPLALLFVVDAMPPATMDLVSAGWVPTIDLTAYVRAIPVPGPVRIRFRVGLIQDGFVDEVCEVWDSSGQLVAQSTQLGAIRVPEGRAET